MLARTGTGGNSRRCDFSIEPLAPSPAETQETERGDHPDNDETDNHKDTGDGPLVVEEGGGAGA